MIYLCDIKKINWDTHKQKTTLITNKKIKKKNFLDFLLRICIQIFGMSCTVI